MSGLFIIGMFSRVITPTGVLPETRRYAGDQGEIGRDSDAIVVELGMREMEGVPEELRRERTIRRERQSGLRYSAFPDESSKDPASASHHFDVTVRNVVLGRWKGIVGSGCVCIRERLGTKVCMRDAGRVRPFIAISFWIAMKRESGALGMIGREFLPDAKSGQQAFA